MPAIQSRVTYRVLKNPISAPERDYTADALVMEDHGDGLCTLVVTPRRSDPFVIGPVIRADLRDPNSPDFLVWEPAAPLPEGV